MLAFVSRTTASCIRHGDQTRSPKKATINKTNDEIGWDVNAIRIPTLRFSLARNKSSAAETKHDWTP